METINDNQELSQLAIKTPKKPRGKPFEIGNPGGPGRPKESYSLKTKIIRLLEANPDMEADVIAGIIRNEKGLLFQMIDGRPSQDITSGGDKLNPTPIYGGKDTIQIPEHNSDEKDFPAEEANTSS